MHYERIDCITGAFTGQGESEYHGAFDVHEPVRVSPDDARVLVAGEVYDGLTLKRLVSVPGEVHDAAWLSRDRLVVVRQNNRVLTRFASDRAETDVTVRSWASQLPVAMQP